MAATHVMSDRIEIYLRTVSARLAALPRLQALHGTTEANSPDQRRVDRDDEREAWDLAVASLEWLDERYAERSMDGRQAERYCVLVGEMREALPTIEKLGLRPPRPEVLRAPPSPRPGVRAV